MKIAYNLLVVLDVDPDNDSAGREWRELSAQLRLAAHHVLSAGAPEPREAIRLSATGRDATVITYLSAVEL